jgi:hypothetical protein
MPYDLVFISPPEEKKLVGENVFFANIPADCKVYAFYYPDAMPDRALERGLRELGERTGKNLFVNIGQLDDPQFNHVVDKFAIKTYPVIVVTAEASLGSPAGEFMTAFARLDGKTLLASPEDTVKCVQELFTQFLQGNIAQAISAAKWAQRKEFLASLAGHLTKALKSVAKYIASRDISFSFAVGKLELKKSGA